MIKMVEFINNNNVIIDIPETSRWTVYDTPTDIIGPTYGHSSAYDPVKKTNIRSWWIYFIWLKR